MILDGLEWEISRVAKESKKEVTHREMESGNRIFKSSNTRR